MTSKLENARYSINSLIEAKTRTRMSLMAHRSEIMNQILNQSDMAVRKLLLELETGGNVRFEDEQKDDPWVIDCENLVKMFIKRVISKNAPRTIQIHRISRLHNRHMKLKFDEKGGKTFEPEKMLYLCFHGKHGEGDDVFAGVEYGCPLQSANHCKGFKGIVLSNYLDCHEDKPMDRAGITQKTLRQAIIFKTNVKKIDEVPEDSFGSVETEQYPGRDAVYQKLANLTNRANTMAGIEGPKEYLVFDRENLFPEYFIEYSLESDLDRYTTQLERLLVDITYSNRISHADMPNIVNELSAKLSDTNEPLKVMLSNIPMAQLELDHPEIKMGDAMPPRSSEGLKAMISVSQVTLEHLTLTEDIISNPDLYSARTGLKSLTMSGCHLTTMPLIPWLPQLERLDLSFNSLTVIGEGIRNLHNLKFLDLAGNQLQDLTSIENVLGGLSALVVLDIRFNPVCQRKGYRHYILARTQRLQVLDAVPVTALEKEPSVLEMEQLLDLGASGQPQMFRPLSMRTQSGYGSSSTENEYQMRSLREVHLHMNNDIITTLELDSCFLFELKQLPEKMPNLKWASFRNNNLKDVSPLARYERLEELSLENNEIDSIGSLCMLENLTKLDVSNNKVANVDSAGNFKSLMLLSLENNLVKNLRPFAKMQTLMEFYIGNNLIGDLFSIFPLKELPRLIILDLTGNAVCRIPNFRLFTIFHLSRLKILDGCGITGKEQTQAKDTYMGKLTIELLGEKIGHFTFKNIAELDLRNCKIREIDCLASGDFRNLRKLNFDNNQLVNVDCFTSLNGLRYLSLNNNRIERLLSSDSPIPNTGPSGFFSTRGDSMAEYGKMRPLLPNLEELYLGYNAISRIADLALYRMSQLKVLFLQGNRISKIDGLEQMTSLVELVLDKNQVKAADPLSFLSLINLKELHIKENRIRTLVHFDCLPNLQMLFLANNRVHEVSEIEKMKLPSLVEISLAANAVARKQLYRIALVIRFPQIYGIDGKEVSDDERHRAHAYYLEQCLMREDPVAKLVANSHSQNGLMPTVMSATKHPIRITSVVLDGLEMKLSANASPFGVGYGRP